MLTVMKLKSYDEQINLTRSFIKNKLKSANLRNRTKSANRIY